MTYFTYTQYRTWTTIGHLAVGAGGIWALLGGVNLADGNFLPTLLGLAVSAAGTGIAWYAYEHLDPRFRDE